MYHIPGEEGTAKLNGISETTGLKPTTAYGLLQTLEHTGMVTRGESKLDYTLGLNILRLGHSYLNGSGITDRIHMLLTEMVKAVDETAYFELPVGTRYYYLDYVVSSKPLKVVPDDNRFIDLPENSAVAKLFTNYDREFTYSTDLEEVDEGLNCFAVPFRTGDTLVDCVALTGPSYRFTEEKMEEAYQAYIRIMTELGMENHL